jgi:hypothetical protein
MIRRGLEALRPDGNSSHNPSISGRLPPLRLLPRPDHDNSKPTTRPLFTAEPDFREAARSNSQTLPPANSGRKKASLCRRAVPIPGPTQQAQNSARLAKPRKHSARLASPRLSSPQDKHSVRRGGPAPIPHTTASQTPWRRLQQQFQLQFQRRRSQRSPPSP